MDSRAQVERIQLIKILYDAAVAHSAKDPDTAMEMEAAWENLREEVGDDAIEQALGFHPISFVTLDDSHTRCLVSVYGHTYLCEQAEGTALAQIQWRMGRVETAEGYTGPYFACRLADGTMQCDCADWTYRVALSPSATVAHCKHLRALASLGRI